MNQAKARQIKEEVLKTLAPLGEKLGVKFDFPVGGTLGSTTLTVKLEAAEINTATGEVQSTEVNDYKTFCQRYGLKPEWLNQSFNFRGNDYKITGLNMRKHKKVVQIEGMHNKQGYSATADMVIRCMSTTVK